MKTNKRSLVSLVLVLIMVLSLALTGCGQDDASDVGNKNGGETEETSNNGTGTSDSTADADGIEKPDKITIMVDGTLVTQENGRDEFEAKWEELTGIELEIIQPDHDAYSDKIGQTFASGDWPDVILLNSAFYAGYASEGVLWDMTDAWEDSELKASGRIKDEALVEGLKIDAVSTESHLAVVMDASLMSNRHGLTMLAWKLLPTMMSLLQCSMPSPTATLTATELKEIHTHCQVQVL